jgi:flagellar biosynthesis protein FlhF
MECFVEQGEDYRDCMSRIMAKYGDKVVPVRQRKVRIGGFFGIGAREGVEVEFYIPSYYSRSVPQASSRAPQTLTETWRSSAIRPDEAWRSPALRSDEIRFNPEPRPLNPEARPPPKADLDFEERKGKVIAAAGKDPTLQLVLSEVRSIKEKMDAEEGKGAGEEEHPAFARIRGLLEHNDFSLSYSEKITERMRKECSLDTLDNFEELDQKVLEWIGEGIQIYRGETEPYINRARIFILVGPTGVGKTTTIAKLAAAYGVYNQYGESLRVRMITIDGYRVAAKEQLEKYGKAMEIPVAYAATIDELRAAISLYGQDADIVFVDTIGKSPRDAMKLGEMKEFLASCGSLSETHLAIAATTKYSDIKDIMRQFAPFNYRSVIITKLDETIRTGNVLSALADQRKAVSYITDGQSVEKKHLHRASVIRFLKNLEGFRINRSRLEERFADNGDTDGRSS